MTQIKKILDKQGNEFYPKTHTKAVIDDNGYNIESRLDAMHDEINAAQLEIGAVPMDLTPTQGNTTHVVSSAGIKNALEVIKSQYGFTELMGQALLSCMRNVAWTTGDGELYYQALEDAINHASEITGLSAEYTQTHYVYDISSLDEIKQDLSVYAVLGNGVSIPIQNYTLSGQLSAGTSTIAVSYAGFTTTISVTVTGYGTRMSYSIESEDLTRFHNRTIQTLSSDNTVQAIYTNANTAREVVLMPIGLNKIKYDDGVFTDYYPIPIPTNATEVTITISSGYVFGARVLFYTQDNYHYGPNATETSSVVQTDGWTTGQTYTLNLGNYAGSSNMFLIINVKKTSGAIIYDTDIYNVQINFT